MQKPGKEVKSNKKKGVIRPRTAYNFFYRHQRDVILKLKSSTKSSMGLEPVNDAFMLRLNNDPNHKRPHRKTHGLIGLQQLTKIVAKRWKEADAETKQRFQALADKDKLRYDIDLKLSSNNKGKDVEEDIDISQGSENESESSLKNNEQSQKEQAQEVGSSYDIEKNIALSVQKYVKIEKNFKGFRKSFIESSAILPISHDLSCIKSYTDTHGITWTEGEIEALQMLS